MRQPEVTDEAIVEAGKRLVARGRTVTKTGLRQELGAGNFDRLFAVWQANQAKELREKVEALKLPDELESKVEASAQRFVAELRELYAALHEAAMRSADDQVRRAEEACRLKLEAAVEDAAAAERESERLESEMQAASSELGQLRSRLEDAYRELRDTREQHTKLKDQLIEARGDNKMVEVELRGQQHLVAEMIREREQAREKHLEELAAVHREVAATREQLAHAQGQVAALTQQLAALVKQIGASDVSDAS